MLNNSVLLPPPFLVGLIRRRAMMKALVEKGTLVASASYSANDFHTAHFIAYEGNKQFEMDDVSWLGSSATSCAVLPIVDSALTIFAIGITNNFTKVDATHVSTTATISSTLNEEKLANSLLSEIKTLRLPYVFPETPTEYRLDIDGYFSDNSKYDKIVYRFMNYPFVPMKTSDKNNENYETGYYKGKVSIWFAAYKSGSTGYITIRKTKSKVYKRTASDISLLNLNYDDETSYSTSVNSGYEAFSVDCFGPSEVKLYQL